LETTVKAKMLTFVLPTEKHLALLFWTFFKYFCNHSKLEKTETTKNFCWCRSIFPKANCTTQWRNDKFSMEKGVVGVWGGVWARPPAAGGKGVGGEVPVLGEFCNF